MKSTLKKERESALAAANHFVVGPPPRQTGTGRVIRPLPDDDLEELKAECERLRKALVKAESKLTRIGAILK
jgi:hypothetical protein